MEKICLYKTENLKNVMLKKEDNIEKIKVMFLDLELILASEESSWNT